eukprot:m.133068 g.133068  ORF g.133068 m.133068 type:complete len:140 (-) comp9845_c0_seq5:573-992(-)
MYDFILRLFWCCVWMAHTPRCEQWSEVRGGGGASNFITGAGGFLQGVWAGYGSVRLQNGVLRFGRPRPLPGSSGLRLIGLSYRGAFIDCEITGDGTYTLALNARSASRTNLVITIESGPTVQLTTVPRALNSPCTVSVK